MTKGKTIVSIDGEKWHINGVPTYAARTYRGWQIEGLLLNSRMIQATFDDENELTKTLWAYPDTGEWDPERNTDEFVAAMPDWRRHGLLGITVGLQGGAPSGYYRADSIKDTLSQSGITAPEMSIWAGLPSIESQPWLNSAFASDGSLKARYFARLSRVVEKADYLGMVVILCLFYFGQDERLQDEVAVKTAVENTCRWVLEQGFTNVVIDMANECDHRHYEHAILQPDRIHELINLVKATKYNGRRLLAATSFLGRSLPVNSVVEVSDFILMHGNGVKDPAHIAKMVEQVRACLGYTPMPILFNEDDHFDFDKPDSNFVSALSRYAGWGYFDAGEGAGGAPYFSSNYRDSYQSVPVNWRINTPRKRAFFDFLAEVTGSK